MAGDNDWDAIFTIGVTNGPNRLGVADGAGHVGVRDGLAMGNFSQLAPDLFLEIGPCQRERQLQGTFLAGKIIA